MPLRAAAAPPAYRPPREKTVLRGAALIAGWLRPRSHCLADTDPYFRGFLRPSEAVMPSRGGVTAASSSPSMEAAARSYGPSRLPTRDLRFRPRDGLQLTRTPRTGSPTMCARPGRDQLGRADVLCGSIAAFAARRSPRKWIVNRPRVSMSERRMARSAGRPTSSRRRRSQRFGRRITRVVVGTGGRLMVACPPRPS